MSDERTFSQDEVNAIVSERLKQERTKIMRDVTRREAELAQRETLLSAKADWQKRGLPADLLDSLDMNKEGALEAAAAILENIKITSGAKGGGIGKNYGFGGTLERSKEAAPESALRSAMGLDKKG